ncbi:hypothetical protein DPMN_157082 [Dreissena polymorpha]|uniref:Uncharacterized protein n=1 Tax=Dreissena polymorpha TaxID=45954 RepID=A0A9D4EGF7_DREPO|nr:hypothetical protein DPMN_157082 [Dreissena polymorpha]
MAWVTLDHLVSWLKAGVGDYSYRQLLMVSLFCTDHRCIRHQWEVDSWVGHQVGLELGQVHIECTYKKKCSLD